MFELSCFSCETITLKDGTTFYRLWFTLPDGSFGWLTGNKPYAPGEKVKLRVSPVYTNDTKTNLRLGLRLA